MLQKEIDIDRYIDNSIYLYECGLNRLKWYKDTGNERYLSDSANYINAANVYMKEIIKISMELVINDDICELNDGVYNKDCIAEYLNAKLYTDPEFFGDFDEKNIEEIKEFV